MSRILCVPDTHFPFQHPNFFTDFARHIRYFRPTHIVHMGDIVDFHAISRHDPDPEAPSAKDELAQSKVCVNKFVNMIPKSVKTFICVGNHDNRIEKKAAQNHIPKAFLKSTRELFSIPDTWQVEDYHQIGDIAFVHGQSNLRGKACMSYGCNVVQGHFHSMLEISYHQTPTRKLWSVFTGSGADSKSLALAYGKNHLAKDVYGFTLIENGIPRIVPGTN